MKNDSENFTIRSLHKCQFERLKCVPLLSFLGSLKLSPEEEMDEAGSSHFNRLTTLKRILAIDYFTANF
jgi:hypothetical protein